VVVGHAAWSAHAGWPSRSAVDHHAPWPSPLVGGGHAAWRRRDRPGPARPPSGPARPGEGGPPWRSLT